MHCTSVLKFGRLVHKGTILPIEWLKSASGQIQDGERWHKCAQIGIWQIVQSSAIYVDVAPFRNQSMSKATGIENPGQMSDFLTPVKLG